MTEGKRTPEREPGRSLDRQTERPPTVTSRLVDAASRRLLGYRPGVPGRPSTVLVTDTGQGVPEIERAALDRETESPLVHGGGVGLWLVTWVSNASGGEFTLEGRPGRSSASACRGPERP